MTVTSLINYPRYQWRQTWRQLIDKKSKNNNNFEKEIRFLYEKLDKKNKKMSVERKKI